MTGEILFYILASLLILIGIRRFFVNRSVTHYSVGEVVERLNSTRGVLLLDVRSQKEWQQGHLKNAHHIPLHELTRRSAELDKHKNREIICYCQTGNRSVVAAVRLKRFGFSTASMNGGIAEWNFQNRG
jgi:rhodanese-related sulfurtransferase